MNTKEGQLLKVPILNRVIRNIPYLDQVENIEVEHGRNAVRFDWRGTRFRVCTLSTGEGLFVEECHDSALSIGNEAILLQALLINGE